MMKRNKKHAVLLALLPIVAVALTGCSFSFTGFEYRRAESELNSKDYKDALALFRKIMDRETESKWGLDSARQAARAAFFDTKNYTQAIDFYKHLIEFSRDETERVSSQRAVASIYFDNLTDYPRSIEAYNKLLMVETDPTHIVQYRFNLARSYFYLNRFIDSKNEIEQALKLSKKSDRTFELNMFLASIYFNMKNVPQALMIYQNLEQKFPKKAKTENIALNESVCYEEEEKFDSAISELQSIQSTYKDPEFIALKIKRLKEREANMPGARGLRR